MIPLGFGMILGSALPTKLGLVELDLYVKCSICSCDTTRGNFVQTCCVEGVRSMCDNTLGTRMAA